MPIDNSRYFQGLLNVIMSALTPNPAIPLHDLNAKNIGELYANEISKLIPGDISPQEDYLEKSEKVDANYYLRINKKLNDLRRLCSLMENARDITIRGITHSRVDVIYFYLYSIAETLTGLKDEIGVISYLSKIQEITQRTISLDSTKNSSVQEFVEKISKNNFNILDQDNIKTIKKDLDNIGASELIKKISDLITTFDDADKNKNLNTTEKNAVKDRIILALIKLIKNEIIQLFTYDKKTQLSADSLLPILMTTLLSTNIDKTILEKLKNHLEKSDHTKDLGGNGCCSMQIYNAIHFLNPQEKKPAETPTTENTTNTGLLNSSSSFAPETSALKSETQAKKEEKSLSTIAYNFFGWLFSTRKHSAKNSKHSAKSHMDFSDYERSDQDQHMRVENFDNDINELPESATNLGFYSGL
jgi:hypothetical protein